MVLRKLSGAVFACCKRLERFGDRVIGVTGPVFVAFAWILLGVCIVVYFDVVFRDVFWQPNTPWLISLFGTMLSTYLVYAFCFHYYMSCTVSAGSPRDGSKREQPALCNYFLVKQRTKRQAAIKALQTKKHAPMPVNDPSPEHQQRLQRSQARTCKKCPTISGVEPSKPERAHHCRICGTCFYKYDHHCVWLNACVGLNNERYFVLFMTYLAISAFLVCLFGYRTAWRLFDFNYIWSEYYHTPKFCTLLLFVLSALMGFALSIMAIWQFWLIARGETSVESSDNEYYRTLAKSRERKFINPYDLGKKRNLAQFFNITPMGKYHPISILVPIPFQPASDGWTWIKTEGWQSAGISYEEELTDEEG